MFTLSHSRRTVAPVLIATVLGAGSHAYADGASPATRNAWKQYVTATEARIASEVTRRDQPLLIDVQASSKRQQDRAAVVRGEILVAEMPRPTVGGRSIEVPDGRIHHWRGAVFIPRITVPALLDIVQSNPEEHKQPDVVRARMLSRDGDRLKLFLQIQRKQIVTVTYNTEHDLLYERRWDGFATSRAEATRIVEVADPGTPKEREKPAGDDHGFLWALNAYWRYLQVGDGVIVECESISLSRDIPWPLRWLSPIVDGIARESMERTLDSLRARVAASRQGQVKH